jgi:hypothetical protein
MMVVEELLLVELIGWFAFGKLRVGKCCIRYVDVNFFVVFGSLLLLLQLPGHKGTVTSVDFHPKEPIGMSFFLSRYSSTNPVHYSTYR